MERAHLLWQLGLLRSEDMCLGTPTALESGADARHIQLICQYIIDGRISPYDGAARIWHTSLQAQVRDHSADPFICVASRSTRTAQRIGTTSAERSAKRRTDALLAKPALAGKAKTNISPRTSVGIAHLELPPGRRCSFIGNSCALEGGGCVFGVGSADERE